MLPVIKYALAALLLLASSFSYAANLYSWWSTAPMSASPQAACSLWATSGGRNYSDEYTTQTNDVEWLCIATIPESNETTTQQRIFTYYDECPEGFEDDGSGQCVEDANCPDAGADSATFTTEKDASDMSFINYKGCWYEYNNSDGKFNCWISGGETYCTGTYTSSSLGAVTDGTSDIVESTFPDYTDSTDSRETTSDSFTDVSDPVILADGTVTDTETTTQTTNSDSGTLIEDGDNSVVVTESDGTTSTNTNTTTTVTNPDGSSTVSDTTSNTVTSPNTSRSVINKGSGSITNSEGSSTIVQDGNTTTIKSYDSSGNLVSSATTSEGTGEGTGTDDETKEGNCGAPGQPPCAVTLEDTSEEYASEFQELADAQAELDASRDSVIDTFTDDIDDSFDLISDLNPVTFINKYFNLGLPSTCTGSISTTIFEHAFVLEPCEKLQPMRDILSWSWFILTLFLCANMLFKRSPL